MTLHTDPHFKVILDRDASSPNPQRAIWTKQHFCVSEDHRKATPPTETRAGEIILEHELKGNRGHWSVLQHAHVSFNCYGFPHATMVQLRTHAGSGFHFLAQSGRYTGERFIKVSDGLINIEDVFCLSPVGAYQDRQGNRYAYTEHDRRIDLEKCGRACDEFKHKVAKGCPYERAREATIPYSFRQEFGCSGSLRSLFHVLDVRSKADAEWGCQVWSELVMEQLDSYCPELAAWYREKRYGKAITSP